MLRWGWAGGSTSGHEHVARFEALVLQVVDHRAHVDAIEPAESDKKSNDADPEILVFETLPQARLDDRIGQAAITAERVDLSPANRLLHSVGCRRAKEMVHDPLRQHDRRRRSAQALPRSDADEPIAVLL
jgi:hypothetical protein